MWIIPNSSYYAPTANIPLKGITHKNRAFYFEFFHGRISSDLQKFNLHSQLSAHSLHLPLRILTFCNMSEREFGIKVEDMRLQNKCAVGVQSVKKWPTPKALEVSESVAQWSVRRTQAVKKSMGPSLSVAVLMEIPETYLHEISHLNPRWVEVLMGLPLGWVLPTQSKPFQTAISVQKTVLTNSSWIGYTTS